jgi:signal transduction histidine kinase
MSYKVNTDIARRFQIVSELAWIPVFFTGAVVMIGWAFGIPDLKSVFPSFVTMKPNTAVAFVLIGIALYCARTKYSGNRAYRSLLIGCASIVVLIGFFTLCEYISGINLGIDQMIFKEVPGAVLTLSPGRMAPNTAVNFMLIGFVLIFLDVRKNPVHNLRQLFILLEIVISFIALVGYLYGSSIFYFGIARYTAMAVHTTVLFIITGLALFFARPNRGLAAIVTAEGIGGRIARLFLPFAILLPLTFGGVKLFWEKARLIPNEFGVGLVAIANITFAVGYILWLVHSINRAEAKRAQAEAELQESYNKLKIVQNQLVQSSKMASIGQLASGVAHEINNPLVGVLNNVQLIKIMIEQGKSYSADELVELLKIVEESAKRCQSITRSLLNFAKASKGIQQKISLNEIIEQEVDLLGQELALSDIEVRKQLQAGLPDVYCDPQLIKQAIFDIIANAKWAIEHKINRQKGLIAIETGFNPQNREIVISIADNGMGISQENINRMFEPFFTTKALGEGTGLGLSIVYGIIRAQKGRVEVESKVGEGANFKIYLPAVSDAV